jgi:DNA-binding CsgD family transcriptional regulator/tetratricopeptide (TPR) repeat protein
MREPSSTRAAGVRREAGRQGSPARAVRPPGLLGRRDECDTLDRLVVDVVAGTSRVLVLRGDAGVGKSALLAYLSERTAGWRVTTAVGVESEPVRAYSGLHRLCTPLLAHLEQLPPPQHDALATVFGLRPGPAPDGFLVGLATLSLFAEAAEEQPLACVVDDAQWLDPASAQALAFVARRLPAERVALVCAARTGAGDDVLAGSPALAIRGLGDGDARALLLTGVHGPLDTAVTDRIVAESHGNPLALLEPRRAWRQPDLAGGFGLLDAEPGTGTVAQNHLRRLATLPVETRLLVLTAAAEPAGDPGLLARAAESQDVDLGALVPAVDAGILSLRRRVEFANSLVRSAVYRAATPGDRHRVHRALAEATDALAEPDRHAWHRSRAAAGPDESVAAELERSAVRAQARGGLAAGGAFLTRAAQLTPDPALRVGRALDAAFADVAAGTFDAARAMLDTARAGPADEFQRALADLAEARLASASREGSRAVDLLLAAARRLAPLDASLARETCLEAFAAVQFGVRVHDGCGIADVARAARTAPPPPEPGPTAGDLVLDAFVAFTEDYATAVPAVREALRRLGSDLLPQPGKLQWHWPGSGLALGLWDAESASALSGHQLRTARGTGALTELSRALGSHTSILVFRGELSEAAALVEEARALTRTAGISEEPYGALTLTAWRGRAREAGALFAATSGAAGSGTEWVGDAVGEYARAVLYNGLGRYDEALVAARRACADPQELVAHNWGLPELVESAVRTGRRDLATDALHRLTSRAAASGTPWGLGVAARSRALLSDGDAAEAHFREAIDQLGRAGMRAELARARLLYGEWLRRAQRRTDARQELTTALEMSLAMGLAGFAQRARDELRAVGPTVRRRRVGAPDALTEQEAQIARLARDGLSNPEIGAQLFISARTVEWHLRKVFTKLGITSRRQLRQALPDDGRSAAHA